MSINNFMVFFLGNYWEITTNLQWSKSLQKLPKLTINEIEDFFKVSGKTGKTQKRAENLLVVSCSHDDHYCVKAICSASYTKSQYHQLSCSLSRSHALVKYGYCTCKAGQGGFCNHVYALLKMMAPFVLDKVEEIRPPLPCTSRPWGWTVPPGRQMDERIAA